ncbi:serine hydrolase domain-containing protein [Shivajiella indica]|uniref:Serine hydrolase domain-containing protein n=1 Tax=Shivajiella indica TaxID=872115 RepID=A0ABW5B6J6_9BACT
MNYKVLSIIIATVFCCSCQHKTTTKELIEYNLESLLDSIYQAHPNGVGFILHVEVPEKNISWSGAVGYTNRETKELLQKDQPGQIGSITKTFVSCSILRLIEMGKIELFQSIKSLVPERTAKLLAENGYPVDSITVGHLLSHRSSIPSSSTMKWIEKEQIDLKYRWSRDEQIQDVITNAKRGKLGSFDYSDINYNILTEIIEEVEETSFYLAMRKLLKYEELGLNHTWFYTLEGDPKNAKARFHQYKESRNWVSTYDESPNWGLWGGSGIVSTAEDLAKFCQALSTNNIFENRDTFKLMFTSLDDENPATGIGFDSDNEQYASQYKMGITQIDGIDFRALGHDGYWGSLMYHLPEYDASFAFFGLNADELIDFDKLFKAIIRAIKPL